MTFEIKQLNKCKQNHKRREKIYGYILWHTQGRRQKIFQEREWGGNGKKDRKLEKKYRKIAKKDRKIALLSLYLLYLYHV